MMLTWGWIAVSLATMVSCLATALWAFSASALFFSNALIAYSSCCRMLATEVSKASTVASASRACSWYFSSAAWGALAFGRGLLGGILD